MNFMLRHGKKPQYVPGSRLVRSWCWSCGQPIRVSPKEAYAMIECEECNPRPHRWRHVARLTKRQQKQGSRDTCVEGCSIITIVERGD